MTTKNKGISF